MTIKKLIKFGSIGLAVALATVLVFALLSTGVTINQEGFLSVSSNIALAVGEEETRERGLYTVDGGYEYVSINKDMVEIGDISTTDFKPHLKLNRWGEECDIDLEFVTAEKVAPIVQPDKIKWNGNKIACEFIPQPPSEKAELGGFKFNIIHKEKPKTNVSTLKFKAKGLKFYYQPALTLEEIAEGAIRPDNVVGSYAVYHATRTNMHASKADADKYKCGKAFHWYRPLIWDAEGRQVWGELNVDAEKGIRTITIPQDFLDSAVYPVTIDDTFGYTEVGETETSLEGRMKGSGGTPNTGTGFTIHTFLESGSGAHKAKAALYDLNGEGPIEDGTCPEISIPYGEPAWHTFTFSAAPSLNASLHYATVWGNEASSTLLCYSDTVGGYNYGSLSLTYNGWPASLSVSTGLAYSIYCTYTPADGEANISNAPSSKAFGVVSANTSYWSKGLAPTFPLDDDECYFTITNNGDTCSITIVATNFIGGVGWILGAPAEDVVRLKAGLSGDANEDAMVTLTTSPQVFISGLVTSIKWELKMETPISYTDGVEKTSIITLIATLD